MARNKKTSESLCKFMGLVISILLKNGQFLTMQHYKAALNSFMRFLRILSAIQSSGVDESNAKILAAI